MTAVRDSAPESENRIAPSVRGRISGIGWSGAALLLALLPAPVVIGLSNASSLLVGGLVVALAVVLSRLEAREHRATFLGLFAWAFALRLAALVALAMLQRADPLGPYLGPDATSYWQTSGLLAANPLMYSHPTSTDALGTSDVAHYYLFAAVRGLLDGDLVAVQVLNAGLAALVAPLMFSWSRALLPRHALALGIFVALYPSWVLLPAFSLLKDPSLVFATVVSIWALTRLFYTPALASQLAFFAVALAGLTYLRTARFYLAAYLELAVAITVGLFLLRGANRGGFGRRLVLIVLVFISAELAPMSLGWQPSAVLVLSNIGHVLQTTSMREVAPGLIDRLTALPSPSAAPAFDDPTPTTYERGTNAATWLADTFRKLYGPFVWVPPEGSDTRSILASDFVLYPGTALWYGFLPFVLVGLAIVFRRATRPTAADLPLIVVSVFVVIYLLQYLAINVSYRQREAIIPILALHALLGLSWWERGVFRSVYFIYLLALFAIATLHTAVRLNWL